MTSSLAKQQDIVLHLKKRNTYPHRVSKKIKVEETHISWVFLTGPYAYKIKKALKFGKVLNFSTLELRKKICQKEVILNTVLCRDMYRGVVKIADLNNDNNKIRIRQLQKRGRALEYAVKMVEIPQKYRMDNLVDTNKVSLKTMERLAEVISDFHRSTQTNTRIMNFGQPKFIRRKINENFETLGKLTSINPKFKEQLISFVINNNKLFYSRIREHKIREIHGDLYLKNIFIVQKKKFYLYDRIEFNDSLRYADVAEDIAHLSMDLDYHKRNDLRKYFISQYINKSEDVSLGDLIYFLMCYKACVRAKVSYFRAKNEPIIKKRVPHLEESKNLLRLAESYLGLF